MHFLLSTEYVRDEIWRASDGIAASQGNLKPVKLFVFYERYPMRI